VAKSSISRYTKRLNSTTRDPYCFQSVNANCFFYGKLSVAIYPYHPMMNITIFQNSRNEMQLSIYILCSIPLVVLKVTYSTNSTKTLKIKNATNSTSVSCNHPFFYLKFGVLTWDCIRIEC